MVGSLCWWFCYCFRSKGDYIDLELVLEGCSFGEDTLVAYFSGELSSYESFDWPCFFWFLYLIPDYLSPFCSLCVVTLPSWFSVSLIVSSSSSSEESFSELDPAFFFFLLFFFAFLFNFLVIMRYIFWQRRSYLSPSHFDFFWAFLSFLRRSIISDGSFGSNWC